MNGLATAGAHSQSSLELDHGRQTGATGTHTLFSNRFLRGHGRVGIGLVTIRRPG